MIIKEFIDKDTSGKNRLFIEAKCQVCGTVYRRQKRQQKELYTCSIGCNSIAKGSTIELNCDHCGELFLRGKSKLKLSKSGKYFCSRLCKDKAQSYMLEIQPDHYGSGEYSDYRTKALYQLGCVCIQCGYSNKDALEVHHIDRNRGNNNISNLEVLCANCHTLKHKYGH
jgi:hypothetical protein